MGGERGLALRIGRRVLVLAVALGLLAPAIGNAAGLTPRIAQFHSGVRQRLVITDRPALLRAHRGDVVRFQWQARREHHWTDVNGATHASFTVTARWQDDAIRVLVTLSSGRRHVTSRSNPSVPLSPPIIDSTPPTISAGARPSPYVPNGWSGPNPPLNCRGPRAGANAAGTAAAIIDLDYCGATVEGLAPVPLPVNWASLTDTQQGFVLLNLERIERGETPFLGESATLDGYAMEGAVANTDPDPSGEVEWSGSNWFSGTGSAAAVGGYLYDDGPGSGNLACSDGQTWGCWGHRDNILDDGTGPDLGVGLADGPNGDSTEIFGSGYSDFDFSWGGELAAGYPGGLAAAALGPAAITQVWASGKHAITVAGMGLDTVTGVYFADVPDENPWSCSAPTLCRIELPKRLRANTTYTIYLLNPAGLSVASAAGVSTTAPTI
jgi:hypothetical protein